MGPFFILLGSLAAAVAVFLLLDLRAIKKRPDYVPKEKKNKEDKLIEQMAETVARNDSTLEQQEVEIEKQENE